MKKNKISIYLLLMALCTSAIVFGPVEVVDGPDSNFEENIKNDDYVNRRTQSENWRENENAAIFARHANEKNEATGGAIVDVLERHTDEERQLKNEHGRLIARRAELDRQRVALRPQSPLVERSSSVSGSPKSEPGAGESTPRNVSLDGSLGGRSDKSNVDITQVATPENLNEPNLSPKSETPSEDNGKGGSSEANVGASKSPWARFVDWVKGINGFGDLISRLNPWREDVRVATSADLKTQTNEAISYGFINALSVDIMPDQLIKIGVKEISREAAEKHTELESLRNAQQIIKTDPDWRNKIIRSIQREFGDRFTPALQESVQTKLDNTGLPMPAAEGDKKPSLIVAEQLLEEVSGKTWNQLLKIFRDKAAHDKEVEKEAIALAKQRYSTTNFINIQAKILSMGTSNIIRDIGLDFGKD